MTRKEFQKKYDEKFGLTVFPNGNRKSTKKRQSQNILEIEWVTGGESGGNCWGEDLARPVEGDEEPAFDELNEALEYFASAITYLHYLDLTKLFELDSRTNNEYYGNYYIYTIKKITLDNLYNFLAKHDYI